MPFLRTSVRILGLTAGVAAAFGLYGAARRLRSECPPEELPLYGTAREMVRDAGLYWRHPEELAALYDSSVVAHPFSAKVALAALGDGGCRASTALAYLFGIMRGLSVTEVRALLGGSAAHATAGEAPAVLFARHYRLTEGLPDPAMVVSLVEAYGQGAANDLLRYLRMLLLVLRISRSFDALAARMVGLPRRDSTLRGEVAVVWTSLFGLLPLLPVMRWRARRISRGGTAG